MAYVAWSVVFGEQPSAAKWNILGTNDASFNNGTGFAAGAIPTAALANASVTANKLATGAVAVSTTGSSTTASTSYGNLADAVTSSVTTTIGANGLALVLYSSYAANSVAAGGSYLSFSASGANTIAAGANASQEAVMDAPNNSFDYITGHNLLTGLTAGSTTFTLAYKVDANTGTFKGRHLSVIPL